MQKELWEEVEQSRPMEEAKVVISQIRYWEVVFQVLSCKVHNPQKLEK
jgi:hypothetical protein